MYLLRLRTPITSIRGIGMVRSHVPDSNPKYLENYQLALQIAANVAENECLFQTEQECRVAWDTFDEIHTAMLRRKEKEREKDALERYCLDHPDDVECKIYDV
jgi:hypothetical protein